MKLDTEAKVVLLLVAIALAKMPRIAWPEPSAGPEWWKKTPRKGNKAGPGATTAPNVSAPGGANVWSEATMQSFVHEMANVPIDPELVLLGIAVASNFNADEFLGSNTGLLMVRREDLSALGYPGVPTFEQIDAPHQIPWIARVLAFRIGATDGVVPRTVGDLAVLLHPSNPTITEMLRNEAERRAASMKGDSLYLQHKQLLDHVLHVGTGHGYPGHPDEEVP